MNETTNILLTFLSAVRGLTIRLTEILRKETCVGRSQVTTVCAVVFGLGTNCTKLTDTAAGLACSWMRLARFKASSPWPETGRSTRRSVVSSVTDTLEAIGDRSLITLSALIRSVELDAYLRHCYDDSLIAPVHG